MPWSTDGRWLSEREKQKEREVRKAIPTETYRRPFVLVGEPGGVKTTRWVLGKGHLNVRHKTLVVLECGHGEVRLNRAAHDNEIDPVRLAEVRAVYGPLENGTYVATKDVHPLIDLSEEEQAFMVAEGKQLPRPLRSMTCNVCLNAAMKIKAEQTQAEFEQRKAEWMKSGQKAALDSYIQAQQEKQTYWEELDQAAGDALESRVTALVEDAFKKLGVNAESCLVFVAHEGGLTGPSENETISTPIGTEYVSSYTEEDVDQLGQTASFTEVTVKIDREAMVRVLTFLGLDPAGLDASFTKNEVIDLKANVES